MRDDKPTGTRYIQRNMLPILQFHDFAEVMDDGYGFSIYRGILIGWDEDYDTRIFRFIDEMTKADRRGLIGAAEHNGRLFLLWKNLVPYKYGEGQQVEVLRDIWNIIFSENLDQDTEAY